MEGQTGLFDDLDEGFKINERHGSLILTNDNEDNRRMVEQCYRRHKTTVNPIIDWTDEEVWEFIKAEKIPYCGLYDEEFKRLGCIGCPMARFEQRLEDFRRWPKYKKAYLLAFRKMIDERVKRGKIDGTWRMGTSELAVFRWWMEYDRYGEE